MDLLRAEVIPGGKKVDPRVFFSHSDSTRKYFINNPKAITKSDLANLGRNRPVIQVAFLITLKQN